MSWNKLPADFKDKPRLTRWWINIKVLLHLKAVKTECCETFRKGFTPDGEQFVACAGCPTRYDKNSESPCYRYLARWAKERAPKKKNGA